MILATIKGTCHTKYVEVSLGIRGFLLLWETSVFLRNSKLANIVCEIFTLYFPNNIKASVEDEVQLLFYAIADALLKQLLRKNMNEYFRK